MNESGRHNLVLVNPNWSAFVLLIILLSAFNSAAILLLPLDDEATRLLHLVNFSISVILWADFLYLLRRSADRRYFMVRQHGWMVLIGTFPFLRVFRVLWFQRLLKAEGYNVRQFLARIVIKRNAQGTLLLIVYTVIVVFEVAAVSILSLEDTAPGSNIETISDAVWWAFSTVTTVGYGDRYPVTQGGRLIAIMLMAVGIALFSVITGSLAEWFRQSQSARPPLQTTRAESGPAEAVAQMKQLLDQQERAYLETIYELKRELAELEASL